MCGWKFNSVATHKTFLPTVACQQQILSGRFQVWSGPNTHCARVFVFTRHSTTHLSDFNITLVGF